MTSLCSFSSCRLCSFLSAAPRPLLFLFGYLLFRLLCSSWYRLPREQCCVVSSSEVEEGSGSNMSFCPIRSRDDRRASSHADPDICLPGRQYHRPTVPR